MNIVTKLKNAAGKLEKTLERQTDIPCSWVGSTSVLVRAVYRFGAISTKTIPVLFFTEIENEFIWKHEK